MAEESVKNEEISNEVESEVSGRSIKIAIFIIVSILIIVILIFAVYYLRHLIFKDAPYGFVVAFIFLSSVFGLSLILYLIGSIIKIDFLKKSSFLAKLSGLGVLFVILVFLVIYGPIKPYLQKIFSGIKKAMYEISIQMCYFSPQVVIHGNTEKCLPKDSRKIGYFKNLEILFDDEHFKNSPPRAGKKYRLNVFLNNLNEDGFSWSDIKVKKVEGFANTDDEYIQSYAVHNKELIIPANSKVPIYLDFSTMPTECRDRIKFKIVATADMLTVGSSKMLSLPKYSFQDQSEKIKNELKAFDKRVSSSPGPINVFAWPSNDVITSDEANDFVIQINIHNYENGVAEITDVKLGIQRMYIEIKRCEDLYQEEIGVKECKMDDMTSCKRFSLKDVKLTPKESYTIYCYASINEGKYDESLKESLIVAEVNYLYNFEAVKYFELKDCIRPVITTTVAECEYPRECRKYSCPEGYREVDKKCDITDAVCCEPLDLVETCTSPSICRKDSCPEGYREVNKKCDMTDAVCCEPTGDGNYGGDCPELTDNCATGEILLQKIACEARKEGVPGNIMIGIARIESGLRHCDRDGNVILGDNGNSIGLMQVSKSACSNPFDINENIRCSIRHLKGKCEYSKRSVIREDVGRCDPTGYCTEQGVKCVYCYNVEGVEPKVYTGWNIAIRGYNGWGGCKNPPNYNYVENVTKYASEYYQYA